MTLGQDQLTKLVIALAGVTLALGLRFGTFTASGADSYGYVSQADLWLNGTLIIEQPLHDQVTWRWANWTLSPLGYRPGQTGGTMVPSYAPGLPLLMAAFKFIGGDVALYSVVPLLGALAVWLTSRLGLTLAGPPAAALAAFALMVSPIFLFQLVYPMSDVPATAWWLAAIVTALGGSTLFAVLSGLAAAVAILTRPNLFPLAGLVLGLTLAHHGLNRVGVRRAAAFTVAALPGPIAVAIINNHLTDRRSSPGMAPPRPSMPDGISRRISGIPHVAGPDADAVHPAGLRCAAPDAPAGQRSRVPAVAVRADIFRWRSAYVSLVHAVP